jgi:multidrug transporter EmrE-like cation transporter
MWDGISAVIETLAAYFIFGEQLNTMTQYGGLALIVAGILLLKSGGIPYK